MAFSLHEIALAQMERLPEAREPRDPADCADDQAEREQALRDEFLAALQGDLSAPALFASNLKWLERGTVADALTDALGDREHFQRRAMQILANAAAGRGTQRDAQLLLQDAVAEWCRSWA